MHSYDARMYTCMYMYKYHIFVYIYIYIYIYAHTRARACIYARRCSSGHGMGTVTRCRLRQLADVGYVNSQMYAESINRWSYVNSQM